MKELRAIVAAFQDARERGEPCALATVVRVRGSAYRRPGARMLVTAAGHTAGSVSGGCLETDVIRRARHAILRGEADVATYDSTDEDDVEHGVGLGCRGVVDVLIEPLPLARPCYLDTLGEWLAQRRTGVLARVVRTRGPLDAAQGVYLLDQEGTVCGDLAASCRADWVADAARGLLADGRSRTAWHAPAPGCGESCDELFVERIEPPQPLVLCGAGRDAVPLARLAAELGWDVTLVDPRPGYAVRDRFSLAHSLVTCAPEEAPLRLALDEGAVAVLMTHHYGLDRRLLPVLLRAPLRYLGLLGPQSRAERLLADLAEDGFRLTGEERQRLHAPAGLDIGAETPEEIALSILAEIRAVLQKRRGGPLRDRTTPIHPRDCEMWPAEPGMGTAESGSRRI